MAVLGHQRKLREIDLARNPGLGNTAEYGAGEFPPPTRPATLTGVQTHGKPASIIRAQQTEEFVRTSKN